MTEIKNKDEVQFLHVNPKWIENKKPTRFAFI